MQVAPVLRCADTAALVAALATHGEFGALASAKPENAAAVLAAPAAVARGIAVFAPELAGREQLSILVIGAESTDAADQGRWYQTIGAMLGRDMQPAVTLVGSELDTAFQSSLAGVAPAASATCVRAQLADFLSAQPAVNFDLAVMFQPGFQKYRGWLEQSGLARLLGAGTRVMGTSYSTDEYEMERWVLECHGYGASEACVLNPFYLDLGDAQSTIHWGGALWQVVSAPARDFCRDDARLQSLDVLNHMVLHSMTVAGAPSPPSGAIVELSAGDGKRLSLIHIFDRRFVDPASAVLYRLGNDGVLQMTGTLAAADLARYPRDTPRDITRAMWAADIKSRFLLAGYPASLREVDGVAQTRGMFDTLRARAADLFR